jgi:predicted nucleic acid-binding Zn finger protein
MDIQLQAQQIAWTNEESYSIMFLACKAYIDSINTTSATSHANHVLGKIRKLMGYYDEIELTQEQYEAICAKIPKK